MFYRQNAYIFSLSISNDTRLHFRFLKGSMIYFQSCILTNCTCYTNQNMRMSFIADALITMKEHFEFLYKELKEVYDKPSKV